MVDQQQQQRLSKLNKTDNKSSSRRRSRNEATKRSAKSCMPQPLSKLTLSKLNRTNITSSYKRRRNVAVKSNAKANMCGSKNTEEKQESCSCTYDHSFETPLPTRYYVSKSFLTLSDIREQRPKPSFHDNSRRNDGEDSCIHIPATNPDFLVPDF
jgi:hypothetical protein